MCIYICMYIYIYIYIYVYVYVYVYIYRERERDYTLLIIIKYGYHRLNIRLIPKYLTIKIHILKKIRLTILLSVKAIDVIS